MPQADFYNKKTKKIESLLTDFFYCGVCGGDVFVFSKNPAPLSVENGIAFIQKCQNCGSTIFSDRNDYPKNRRDYVLNSLYLAQQKKREVDAPKSPKGFTVVKT